MSTDLLTGNYISLSPKKRCETNFLKSIKRNELFLGELVHTIAWDQALEWVLKLIISILPLPIYQYRALGKDFQSMAQMVA